MLTWPFMLELLGCQKIPGQTWPGPGHGTPDVNSGTVPGIPGQLATLRLWLISGFQKVLHNEELESISQ